MVSINYNSLDDRIWVMSTIFVVDIWGISQEGEEDTAEIQSLKTLYRALSARAQWGRGSSRQSSHCVERSKSEVENNRLGLNSKQTTLFQGVPQNFIHQNLYYSL